MGSMVYLIIEHKRRGALSSPNKDYVCMYDICEENSDNIDNDNDNNDSRYV